MDFDELNLTDEQLEALQKHIQSETDKVRTKYSQEIKGLTEELAKYKPKEKTLEEKALEDRIAALEAKEAELSNREQLMNLQSKLKERGLNPELAQYLTFPEDKQDESLNQISGFFLGDANIPKGHSNGAGLSKDDFRKLNYAEKARLYQENPKLYEALSH